MDAQAVERLAREVESFEKAFKQVVTGPARPWAFVDGGSKPEEMSEEDAGRYATVTNGHIRVRGELDAEQNVVGSTDPDIAINAWRRNASTYAHITRGDVLIWRIKPELLKSKDQVYQVYSRMLVADHAPEVVLAPERTAEAEIVP